jgi:hypothetical protein
MGRKPTKRKLIQSKNEIGKVNRRARSGSGLDGTRGKTSKKGMAFVKDRKKFEGTRMLVTEITKVIEPGAIVPRNLIDAAIQKYPNATPETVISLLGKHNIHVSDS